MYITRKFRNVLEVILVACIMIGACGKQSEQEKRQKSLDMVTIRTLGLAYLEENKLTEAEAEFRKLIDLAPNEALGHANLGLVYMRMANYQQAEEQLKKALEINPQDPEIRLNLAEIYELTQRAEEATAVLEQTLQDSPNHVRTLYKLAQIRIRSGQSEDFVSAESLLRRIAERLPANIAVRLQLVETLLRNQKADQATQQLETLHQQMPELPKESTEYFQQALSLMRNGEAKEALNPLLIFHNFMKVTSPYQAGLLEVRSSAGPLSGAPVLTFSRDVSVQLQEQESILEALRFTDATEAAGLGIVKDAFAQQAATRDASGALAAADFDQDGDQDLYVSVWNEQTKENKAFLFRNEFGRFTDMAEQAGIKHPGRDKAAVFADYDNDGFLDLFVSNTTGNLLYRNVAEGQFQDMATKAGIKQSSASNMALLADLDHDGDLDIYVANDGPNQIFRNNLDGTFTELSERMGLAGGQKASQDMAIGDFDDDGDLDLFVANAAGPDALFTNLRGGRFQDIAKESGVATETSSGAVTVGDYNNDGFLDIFVTSLNGGPFVLYRNKGDGSFESDNRSQETMQRLSGVVGLDAHFFDFDNDGFLDLLVVGEPLVPNSQVQPAFLLHNDGTGQFEDRSSLLPSDLQPAHRISAADYNEDGDLDIFLSNVDGGVSLLRNDGGNVNKYLKLQLVGLRTGSGKNNHFGIGSKIEVRAGDLYQIRVVDAPVSHFGLGQRLKSDVVRILWPNGVPENLFFPGSDQDIIEEQTLKGSCAFLYTWTGEKYEFATDVMWRSALGMPLGIMGGETAYASAKSSNDYFRIPGEMLKARDGLYQMQLTEELWETAYFDKLRLITVDHPESTEVYIDERINAPHPLKYFTITTKNVPEKAFDDQGNDLLPVLRDKDAKYAATFDLGSYQGLAQMHDLVLDLGDLQSTENLHLFLTGWIFPTDASINVAISQSDLFKVVPPYLQVPDSQGNWKTAIENIGFPMGKDKTVIVDLMDKFLTKDYRVRIRTNMQIYWDHVFHAITKETALQEPELTPIAADLHYRGFSRLYRKGGRYGPHWFDYASVSTGQKWRDLIGSYTTYGDVLPLLHESDNKYVIINAGDEMTVQFDASSTRQVPQGWTRTFLIYTDGWIKDGDLNTAHGKTVAPLPYHEMSSYPYGAADSFPESDEQQNYHRQYNTREVTKNSLKKLTVNK